MSAFDVAAVRAHLERYEDASGRVHVCRFEDWTGRTFPTTDLDAAADYARTLDEDHAPAGIYVRDSTVLGELAAGSRGSAADTAVVVQFTLDLDVHAPEAHKGDKPLPPDHETAVAALGLADVPDPSEIVDSGHGVYARWCLTEPTDALDDARELLADLDGAVRSVWTDHGWHLDSTTDGARVFRLPGSANRKVPAEPKPCRTEHHGEPYTLDELRSLVPRRPAPTDVPTGRTAGGTGPFAVLAAAVQDGRLGWDDIMKPAGWTHVRTEKSGARLYLRPGGASSEYSARCGVNGTPVAVIWSDATDLPSGPKQRLTPGRLFAHLHRGGDQRAATADLIAAANGERATEAARALPAEVLADIAAAVGPTLIGRAASEGGPTVTLPTLPASFWTARPALAHIRQAAHARAVSADLVLHVVLARLASVVHHETRVETGLGAAGLNLFTAAVGASGAGKTTGVGVGRELIAAPSRIASWDGYRDAVPVGSGEGLAEMFIGTKQEPTGEAIGSGPNRGGPKTKAVRAQTRHNALVHVDEGEALFRMTERKGATIAATLRSAWTGGVLGQSNASAETTRVIPGGSYALGLVIGVQVDTAGPLFADEAGGTPQRFLFCAATDPTIPDQAPHWPGPLPGVAEIVTGGTVVPVVDPDVRTRLRAEHLARHRGQAEESDPLDAHRPLHTAKVAALLALLDGRREATGEDWALAEQVWRTSTAVRTAVIRRGREIERERAERRTAAYVEREERAAIARDQSAGKVTRLAERLAGRVHTRESEAWAALRRSLASRERGLFGAAVEHATAAGWITVSGSIVEPGPESPP